MRGHSPPARLADRVGWIGGAPPADEVGALVHEGIVCRGLSAYGDVARFLADALFRRDLARGGWVVDIGFLRAAYLRDAYRALDALDGVLVRIG